jgi:hypothetical protein
MSQFLLLLVVLIAVLQCSLAEAVPDASPQPVVAHLDSSAVANVADTRMIPVDPAEFDRYSSDYDLDEEDEDGDYTYDEEEYDGDQEDDWWWSKSPSTSHTTHQVEQDLTDSAEVMLGFALGYFGTKASCANNVANRVAKAGQGFTYFASAFREIEGCFEYGANHNSCNSRTLEKVLMTLVSGGRDIASALNGCQSKSSWLSRVFHWAIHWVSDVFPEVKIVEDGVMMVVHGVDIYEDVRRAYDSCTHDDWFHCGDDIGEIVHLL